MRAIQETVVSLHQVLVRWTQDTQETHDTYDSQETEETQDIHETSTVRETSEEQGHQNRPCQRSAELLLALRHCNAPPRKLFHLRRWNHRRNTCSAKIRRPL